MEGVISIPAVCHGYSDTRVVASRQQSLTCLGSISIFNFVGIAIRWNSRIPGRQI